MDHNKIEDNVGRSYSCQSKNTNPLTTTAVRISGNDDGVVVGWLGCWVKVKHVVISSRTKHNTPYRPTPLVLACFLSNPPPSPSPPTLR